MSQLNRDESLFSGTVRCIRNTLTKVPKKMLKKLKRKTTGKKNTKLMKHMEAMRMVKILSPQRNLFLEARSYELYGRKRPMMRSNH